MGLVKGFPYVSPEPVFVKKVYVESAPKNQRAKLPFPPAVGTPSAESDSRTSPTGRTRAAAVRSAPG
jgi:hypothetical protein